MVDERLTRPGASSLAVQRVSHNELVEKFLADMPAESLISESTANDQVRSHLEQKLADLELPLFKILMEKTSIPVS